MRMKKNRILIAAVMAAVMVPATAAMATEGGYGGYRSSGGTGTTASGETMYDKAVAENGGAGTDTTADVESVVDKTMTPDVAVTPDSGNINPENTAIPEQEIQSPQDTGTDAVPESNDPRMDSQQMPDSIGNQNTESNMGFVQPETVPITEVEGTAKLESRIAGGYQANSVNGCAVITEPEVISQSYGLASGEEAYAKILDLDRGKSPVSGRMLDLAANSQGAEICARLNIELGKMAGGKYSLLPSDGGTIQIALGIPSGFVNEEQTCAVACVRKDGTVSILRDQDEDRDTITFNTTGGAGAYAIIRY